MTSFVLIRHGETDWNVIGRYQGQADPPLNETGIAQAEKLARLLSSQHLDKLYSSPLKRAAQTAKIIARELNIPLKMEARLMEIHQGEWQTFLRSEIEMQYPDLFHQWETDPWQVTPPGGEHLSQVQARVYAAIDDILAENPGKRTGLVMHRIPIALVKLRYQDLDPNVVRGLQLPNTFWEEIVIA